ncbi:hypothetical protein, partial [Roseburia hominis]|uniref:hypothetical protein n=1 Tax=Roseburia hominis TaxID=301301 RepID=UPI0034A575B9
DDIPRSLRLDFMWVPPGFRLDFVRISCRFHLASAWISFGFRQIATFLLTSFLPRPKIALIKGSSFHLRMRQTLRAEAEIIIVITPQGRLLL